MLDLLNRITLEFCIYAKLPSLITVKHNINIKYILNLIFILGSMMLTMIQFNIVLAIDTKHPILTLLDNHNPPVEPPVDPPVVLVLLLVLELVLVLIYVLGITRLNLVNMIVRSIINN